MNKLRRTLVTVHTLLAAFFLPVALMFALTGGLYTMSIKGGYRETTHTVALAAPLDAGLSSLVAVAETELGRLSIGVPTGSAGVKKAGVDGWELEWTGVNRDVVLRPTANPLEAKLIVKDTTAWRRLVQLHKAKGSVFGRAISVGWAMALVVLLGSGLTIAWTTPPMRRMTLLATLAGIATFVVYTVVG